MIIGIDFGGMSAKAAVLSENTLAGKSSVETNANDSPEVTALKLAELCAKTAERAGCAFDKIQGIGIGSPGVVDSQTGTVVSWSNFGWKNIPLGMLVQKQLQKPVFVTNDANAAALGEVRFGAGKQFDDSLFLTIGTGIGGGIVLGGKLFEGFRSAGAEVGHMVIHKNGEICSCGRKGCYERYASARALVKITQKAMKQNRDSLLWKIAPELTDVDGKTVFSAVALGDRTAENVLTEYVANLGEGIVNLVNILRPQAVILGGGISAEKDALLNPLKEFVFAKIYVPKNYAPLEIRCAQLGNDAGIFGAARFAEERLT